MNSDFHLLMQCTLNIFDVLSYVLGAGDVNVDNMKLSSIMDIA